jgi:hypothetical protein
MLTISSSVLSPASSHDSALELSFVFRSDEDENYIPDIILGPDAFKRTIVRTCGPCGSIE